MALRKEDLHKLVDQLSQKDQKTAFDFMQYLVNRSGKKPAFWKAIDAAEPDDIPLNSEEQEQLESDDEYISWEQAKHELGL